MFPLSHFYASIVIAVEENEVTSIVGNTAELHCIYSKENIDLSQLRIYWQIADDLKTCPVVHALILGEDNQSDQCNNFKDRTRLLKDKLEDGDFSLLLLNITPRDEHTYRCIVQKKMDKVFKVDYDTAVVLRVAGKEWNAKKTQDLHRYHGRAIYYIAH